MRSIARRFNGTGQLGLTNFLRIEFSNVVECREIAIALLRQRLGVLISHVIAGQT
jgi:hypothetical protein